MRILKRLLALIMAVGCFGGAIFGLTACGGSAKLTYTITLSDQDGEAVVGAEIALLQDETQMSTGTTDDNGQVTGTVDAGEYTLQYVELPYGYFASEVTTVNISEGNTSIALTVENNNPNGTEQRPYFIGVDEYDIQLAAGETVYYHIRAIGKTLIVENANVEISYKGQTYAPEGDKIEILFTADQASGAPQTQTQTFAVVNKSSESQSLTLKWLSPLGSMENPIVVNTGAEETATITGTTIVYYKWTATQNGTFTISSTSAKNDIYLLNLRSMFQTEPTEGKQSVSITVEQGDEVRIAVSVHGKVSSSAVNNIVFTASFE